jgi:hypothetical protein
LNDLQTRNHPALSSEARGFPVPRHPAEANNNMTPYDKAQCIALGRLIGAIKMAACYGKDWSAEELHDQIQKLAATVTEVEASLNKALEEALSPYETEKK